MKNSADIEERYTAFCEKNNLDPIITIAEQVVYLNELGEKRLLKTLNGIINPVVKPKAVEAVEAVEVITPIENIKPARSKNNKKHNSSDLNLKVDTTRTKSNSRLLCANITRSMIANSKLMKNGEWQLGLDF